MYNNRFAVQQKLIQHCKSTILQLKRKLLKKKKKKEEEEDGSGPGKKKLRIAPPALLRSLDGTVSLAECRP